MARKFKLTLVDPALLQRNDSDERYDFVIKNHRRAIRLLKKVQPHQHRQRVWAVKERRNECGTAACALGWVAITNVLPGLQYTHNPGKGYYDKNDFIPVINGEMSEWDTAGDQFFGVITCSEIFGNTSLKMPKIIELMQERIKDLTLERDSARSFRDYI